MVGDPKRQRNPCSQEGVPGSSCGVGPAAALVLLSCTLHPCSASGAAQSLPCSPSQGVCVALCLRALGWLFPTAPHRHPRAQTHLPGQADGSKSLKSLAGGSSCPAAGKSLWQQVLLSISCSWHPEGRGHCQFSLFHMNLFSLWSLVTGSIC